MSVSTLFTIPDLVAHVLVDNFETHNGPSSARCLQIMEELSRGTAHEPRYVDQVFTLATLASKSLFWRSLRVAAVFAVQSDGMFSFTAIFSGRNISGVYEPKTKKGYLNLD